MKNLNQDNLGKANMLGELQSKLIKLSTDYENKEEECTEYKKKYEEKHNECQSLIYNLNNLQSQLSFYQIQPVSMCKFCII